MNPTPHLCAPIDLNEAGPQIPYGEATHMLDFNEVEPVNAEAALAIEREILREENLCAGESERSV